MPRYALYLPFSFEAKDDRTAAIVANLLAHRNALLLSEEGRVVETLEDPLPVSLLSPKDLQERGEAVVAALDTVACGYVGDRPVLDQMVNQALQHPDSQRGPFARVTAVRTAYRRWFLRHDNQVSMIIYSQVEHLVGRLNDMLREVTKVIRVE